MEARYKPMLNLFLVISMGIVAAMVYYRAYALWYSLGYSSELVHEIMGNVYRSHLMDSQIPMKLLALFFATFSLSIKTGASKDIPWMDIISRLVLGVLMFFGSDMVLRGYVTNTRYLVYVVLLLTGYICYWSGAIRLGRRIRHHAHDLDDEDDTFKQCKDLIENDYSINIPMKYQWKKTMHDGWINVINPFRATLVIGIPGSGKSYSVYGPYIHQMIRKGYAMFVYDYKYPDLTEIVYNELLDNFDCYDIKPKMYCVNFDDPEHSHRFNPIHKDYLRDPADATEIAELIMLNVNKGAETKEDFFSMSAKCYIDLLMWFLRIYEDGKFCTFPHLIWLMGQSYKDAFDVIQKYADKYPELGVKLAAFADAARDKAMDQLQGQIASARIPLLKFCDPGLAWILSGNDFTLDINNPKEPKIVCIGNNPDRQSIYGTTLALLTSRLFKQINHKGLRHSAVLIDELPTIYLKGLDNLINTARSNKVAVVIGAQDKSQIVRDYDSKEADVIFNTVGNVFSGAVKGKTAEELSKSFGKALRPAWSHQTGDSNQSETLSYQMRDVLPRHKIEALSQGVFCGYIADTNKQKIRQKLFCGEIQVTHQTQHHEKIPQISFFEGQDIKERIRINQQQIHDDVVNLLEKEKTN